MSAIARTVSVQTGTLVEKCECPPETVCPSCGDCSLMTISFGIASTIAIILLIILFIR